MAEHPEVPMAEHPEVPMAEHPEVPMAEQPPVSADGRHGEAQDSRQSAAGSDRRTADALAIRLVAVADSSPPYDDELPPAHRGNGMSPTGQPPPARALPGPGQPTAPIPPARPSAGRWPSQFAQVLAETLAGARPPQQLTRWTTEQARQRIRQLGAQLAGGSGPQVRRVLATSPASGVIEMAVVVGFGPRVRAFAIRLERPGTPLGSPDPATRPGRARPTGPVGVPGSAVVPGSASWICTAFEAA
jgi:hypothetical protein